MEVAQATIPLEEYMNTSYEYDCDYVDGILEERSLPKKKHSKAQKRLIGFFLPLEQTRNLFCFPEQRIAVSATRVRVADVCVCIGEPDEETFTTPPFLVVEILSPDDRYSRVRRKIDDYLAMGVPHVWLIDPESRRAEIYTVDGMREASDGILRTTNPTVEIPLSEILA